MADVRRDWAASGAKWASVVVLGGASVFGIAWTIATRPAPAAHSLPVAPQSDTIEASRSRTAAENATERADLVNPSRASDAGERDGAGLAAEASSPRRLNINTASAAELEVLPQIGPTLASRIVADRDTNGPFASLDDLDRVPGLGPRTIEKMRAIAVAR